MRRKLSIIFSTIIWFAVITQFVLMLQNRVAEVPETVIRFFSFFTITTNILAAFYFTLICFRISSVNKSGILTALTASIFMVGIVYQIVLRGLWQPAGMQLVVDELLHSVNPILVIIFWYLYENHSMVRYSQIKFWLIYPLSYLIYILVRGSFSNFYPYPFVNVAKIGFAQACINSTILELIFIIVACLFILIGKRIEKRRPAQFVSQGV